MFGKTSIRQTLFLVVISYSVAFIDCRPARGESEDFASEYEPSRVAEADKTTHFIGLNDVLTVDEKISLDIETQTNGRFFLLKKDSELTDLPTNFLAELASTGSCSKEIEVLNGCLSASNGKASISTDKVSKTRQPTNDDCTNYQIDVEECIIKSNRFHPCPPPDRDLANFKNLFVKRSKEFSEVLKKKFELVESDQKFEFGTATGYEIVNYDDEYDEFVKKFLANVAENKLPQPYLGFKNDFSELQGHLPASSKKLNDFKKAIKTAACKKEVANIAETLTTLSALKSKLKKQYAGPKEDFNKVDSSMKAFFETFPQEPLESCSNLKKQQEHVDYKIRVLDALDMRC